MKRTILTTILAAMFAFSGASAQFVAGSNPSNGKAGYGPGNGTGNQGNGPKDGTGYGAKSGKGNGTGTCDRTGPKGAQGGTQGRGGRR
jgi:hypothetical protein